MKFNKLNIENSIAEITLNNPEVLNSFNMEMSLELIDLLSNLNKNNEVRVVILTGAGRAFCAGQDLQEAISGKYKIIEIVQKQYNKIINGITSLEKPVIAMVNGVAAGAGANIALACDFVIASDKSSFIQAFSKIGLIPDSGGTFILPRLVGIAKAKELLMLGDKISASDAEKIGMILKCIEMEQLRSHTFELAKRLAKMPTKALALTKLALQNSFSNSLTEQLNLEAELQNIAGNTYDYKEGVAAFLEKRQPIFEGR